MKRAMDFETLDWDAEVKRVARAFGVVGECEFRPFLPNIWLISSPQHHVRAMAHGISLVVRYDVKKGHKSFILKDDDSGRSTLRDHLRLNFDGSVCHPPTDFTHVYAIA